MAMDDFDLMLSKHALLAGAMFWGNYESRGLKTLIAGSYEVIKKLWSWITERVGNIVATFQSRCFTSEEHIEAAKTVLS